MSSLPRPIALDALALLQRRARKIVLGAYAHIDQSNAQHLLRRVSRELDRLLRESGRPVPVVNEPPPGWTVEEDRREELLAIGEHVAMRRVG